MAHSKESVIIEFAKFIDKHPPGTLFSLKSNGSYHFNLSKIEDSV